MISRSYGASSVERAFCDFIDSTPHSRVLLALSGGADSVVLLHLLHRFQSAYGYQLEALHVHHGIRGAEADRDRDFCSALCKEWKIPLTVAHYDIPSLAAMEKAGLEETARKYRYQALDEFAQAHGFDAIVTAHTATDNVETVLMQLTRGTASLHGIPPVRDAYLRPLLKVSRADILSYLNEYDLPHVEDSTNESNDYSRNLIRHQVLPVLRQLNPRMEDAFGRAVTHSKEDDDYLQSLAAPFAERGAVQELTALPAPLRSRALIARCGKLGIGALSETHLRALARLCADAHPHASLSLPGGSVAIEDGLLVRAHRTVDPEDWEIELHPGENSLPDGSLLYMLLESDGDLEKYIAHQQNIYKLLIKITINFATIEGTVIARSRRAGDRILCGKMHRSVKKLYCDAHVPIADRPNSPLVCDENGILWIPRLGMVRDGAAADGSAQVRLFWLQKDAKESF